MDKNSTGFIAGTPQQYMAVIQRASDTYDIPTAIISALLKQESGFNPNAKSPAGARGIAQFMPGTAKRFGIDPLNPDEAIMAAAQYLRMNLDKFGSMELALAAYNAGEGNVQKYKGIPPFKETQNYVKNIMSMSGSVVPSAPTEEELLKQGYQHIGEDAYYKRDASKPNGFDLVRTGKRPSPSPTPIDARFVAPLTEATPSSNLADSTRRAMSSLVPKAYASELPGPKRSYTQQYAQDYYSPYTVKPGDTLWGIAERTLGSGSKWKDLGYTGNPRQLQPGTSLKVPTPRPAPPPPRTPAPMQSKPMVSVGMSTASGPRTINVSAPKSSPAPLRSVPAPLTLSTPKTAGASATPYTQAVASSAKPIQSSAGGGNVISRLVNAVTNLFR